MIYTYAVSFFLFSLALYVAEHLYTRENRKIHKIYIYTLIPFFLLFLVPFVNIFTSLVCCINIITKNSSCEDWYYNGIFEKYINNLIIK